MKKKKQPWQFKLADLVEKECEECPKKKGDCYLNEIIYFIEGLLKTNK